MKIIRLVCLVLLASMLSVAQDKTQPPPSVPTVLDRQFSTMEHELVPAVEAMPDDKFEFAPTNGEFKGVRTFRQQAMHVATTNYLIAASILGEKAPVDLGQSENGPDNIKSKADVVKFLKESFAYSHKALATVDEKNLTGFIKSPFGEGQITRLGAAMIAVWHPFDHYGQMVEYLRMNGIIPPASRPQK